jgi:4-amino-4-deoxy-L-arabinose transferase-like glycosyltransferase
MAWSDRPDPLYRAGLLAVALTSALYLIGLDRLPIVLGGDEAQFAVHAESLARSGRDLNGTAFPVFIRIADPLVPNNNSGIWYQPLLFYVIAPFVKIFGVSEWAVRLPVALLALVDIWLIYAIGRRMFGDRRYAVGAALLLALTPAHLIVSRQALDYVAPLPFVLGWFLLLLQFLDTGDIRRIALAGFLIGAGLFSYIAAWVLMPIYLLFTTIAIWRSRWPRRPALAACAVGFALPAIALGLALAANQEMLSNTLLRYEVGGTLAQRPGLAERAALYWDYFNPSFLFFAGGSSPTQATSRVGVFLLALLPLMAAGFRSIWTAPSGPALLAAAAFVAAPLPIALTMPPAAAYSIARAMTLLPFGILIAVYGLRAMVREGRLRTIAIVLLISIPLQFALFARDYRSDYQTRAAARLDPGNVGAIADALIAHDARSAVPAIYLSDRIDDGGVRWRFFMLKRGRMDLWARSRSINLTHTFPQLEPGALIVCYASEPETVSLPEKGYEVVAEIRGIAGEPAAVVLKAPG